MSTLLVTGGAGFIGANFVLHWHRRHPTDRIIVLDALTYAGNVANLAACAGDPEVSFVHGDICDETLLVQLFGEHKFDMVVHLAAESHVDRSIAAPDEFMRTNVQGTHALLKIAMESWKANFSGRRFHHVSTDEVYGSLAPEEAPFSETTRYDPRSPYAASKAASDFLVRAYGHTYGLPFTISNCSNNYGSFQFPEKLIPLMIISALSGRPLPVYGDGLNVRDWIYVEDHCAMLSIILERGRIGETYNVGGGNELSNIDLVSLLCELIDRRVRENAGLRGKFPACPAAKGESCHDLLTYVKDRPGHDRRYAIDSRKIREELGVSSIRPLAEGLSATLDWYLANEGWWRSIQTGEYRKWMANHYGIVV